MAQKVLLAFFGLALPVLVGFTISVAGVGVSFTLPAVAGLLLGVFFFFAPDISLRSEAGDRRKEFKRALGSFLDLVVIALAGGAGVESALRDAAGVGRGWAYSSCTTPRSPRSPLYPVGELPAGHEVACPYGRAVLQRLALRHRGRPSARVAWSGQLACGDHSWPTPRRFESTPERWRCPWSAVLGFLILSAIPLSSEPRALAPVITRRLTSSDHHHGFGAVNDCTTCETTRGMTTDR